MDRDGKITSSPFRLGKDKAKKKKKAESLKSQQLCIFHIVSILNISSLL